MSACLAAVMSVVMPAVLLSQEPVAQKPVGAVPVDSVGPMSPADSAHLDSLAQQARHVRCWRARPMPDCRMVFLTDFGLDGPLHTTTSRDPAARYYNRAFDLRMNWSIGLMRNGDRHSHGVSLAVTSEAGLTFPMIAEYRYRRWLNQFALDAGVGLKRHDVWIDNVGLTRGNGLTTLLGISPSRWIGASLRYETMKVRGQRFTGVMLGVQSTRVSEYTFRFLGIALRDWLLGLIGFEWEGEAEGETPP